MKVIYHTYSKLLFTLALSAICLSISAQDSRKKGDIAWDKGKYKTAVNNYSAVENILEDKDLLAKRGLGYFKLNKLKRAINDFTLSKKLGNNDSELYFLMAQTKQHIGEYEEAVFFYKEYLKTSGTKSYKGQVSLREIKNCAYSAFHQKDNATAFVENFGEDVNTYYDEVYALQSPRSGNTFYFSSNRNLKSNNVYAYALNVKGDWEEKNAFGVGINSEVNEYVMDISPDAQNMLFTRTKGQEITTQIYVSALDDKGKQHVVELPEYLLEGAVDLQIVDRNTIAFASKNLGGMGGYDIYTINYKNGVWSDPINAGEIINTEYDERSPYFASTSEYIYFSSNRPYCFGGYDVYYYNILGIATEPTNMGAPLNSSGNDLQFRLNVDGQMAVMSSDRKTGYGAYDIYQVYMQDFKPMPPKDMEQLEYVKDYFNYIKPKEEVVEAPRSHLDELKDRLAEEGKNEPSKEAASVEEAVVEKPKVVTKSEELVSEENDSKEKVTKVVETSKTPKLTQGTETIAEEKAITEEKEREETPDVEQKTKLAEVAVEDLDTEEQTKPKSDLSEPAIPKKASGESPLAAIKQKRKAVNLPNVKAISGEGMANTVLYQDRHDLMNKVNKTKLDKLVSYLKKNLGHRVHFIAHTDHLELGLIEYMQYNTLKRANLISRYLLDNGIGKDRISIESVCANYPFVKPELAGKTNEDYLAYNKRIDWEILDSDNQVLKSQNLDKAEVPGYAIDRKYELYTQLREEVYYSVEIAKSPRIYKNAVLRLYSDLYIRKNTATGDNVYYIGFYNKHAEAEGLKKQLEESSASYAKVVAFFNGRQISKSQMRELSKDYPDLQNYTSANE